MLSAPPCKLHSFPTRRSSDLELKKTSLATVLFDEMKNSLPESAQLHVVIGRAFLATGYQQLATREFERATALDPKYRSEEHTSELQSRFDLVCRLLLEKKTSA